MKIDNSKTLKFALAYTFLIFMLTQHSYSQKNNQTVTISKGNVVPKTSNCDCDKIDFKVRIIKISTTKTKRTYKLQLIDFENKNRCEIKFFNLNWKGQQMVPFSSMRKQNFEKASDDSVSLYEFEFDTKTSALEPDDESQISTSILIKVGEKSCFIIDKQSTYYRQM